MPDCAAWRAGAWQDVWQAADAVSGAPTELFVAGTPTTFEPLNATAFGLDSPLLEVPLGAGALEAACSWQNESQPLWGAAALAASSLPLIVLGTSVTAGCGATNHSCSIEHSWARLLQDYVDWQLGRAFGLAARPRVLVNIYAKNAVGAGYYARCTASKVPPGPGVVLLEVATNLWGTRDAMQRTVAGLVQAVRRAAPEKAIAFAVWPSKARAFARVPEIIRDVARDEGVDVLDFSHMLKHHARGELHARQHYYSQGGADMVHPSAAGHALFGAVVARFVAEGLITGGRKSCAARSVGVVPAADARSERLALPVEQCFERADSLPIASRSAGSSWRIVDEGKQGGT